MGSTHARGVRGHAPPGKFWKLCLYFLHPETFSWCFKTNFWVKIKNILFLYFHSIRLFHFAFIPTCDQTSLLGLLGTYPHDKILYQRTASSAFLRIFLIYFRLKIHTFFSDSDWTSVRVFIMVWFNIPILAINRVQWGMVVQGHAPPGKF